MKNHMFESCQFYKKNPIDQKDLWEIRCKNQLIISAFAQFCTDDVQPHRKDLEENSELR